MTRAKVLLADDHPLVAEGLASLLRNDFDLVGIVSDGLALVDAARRLRPDVIVADLQMPRMSGLEALRRLRSEGIDTRFLFLTWHAEPELAAGVIREGAAGFMLKSEVGDHLHAAIGEVLNGRVYVSAALVRPERRTDG